MDRFDALTAFVAVVDHNGFAPAARHLRISTSATTRHIAALEERLGVRLLNRTTRAVSLTDAGHRLVDRARRILADLDEAERMAETERSEPVGRLVVAAPQVFGRLHVAPLVCEFMLQNPKVQVELLLSDRIANLVEDGIDAAIRIGHLEDSSDIARKVGVVRRVVVASPDYLKQRGRPRVPQDLVSHNMIALTPLTSPAVWRFGRKQGRQEVPIQPTYVTNSVDAAIWHAAQNGGITMALSYQVADHLRDGRLELLIESHEPEPYPVQFVYPASRLLSRKVSALLDLVAGTRNWDFLSFVN